VSASPILALRAAILAHATADAELVALFGGTLRLHDEPPRAAAPVYALFAAATAADWSTDLDRGHEQDVTIAVFGSEGSARDALLVAERLAHLLDGADLALAGHRLVNLRAVETRAAEDEASGFAKAALRLRAVTEVL
jgi:hypothetical protein